MTIDPDKRLRNRLLPMVGQSLQRTRASFFPSLFLAEPHSVQTSVCRLILPPPLLVLGPRSSEVRPGGEEYGSVTLTLASTPLKLAESAGGGLEELILPRLRTGCSWSAGSKILRLFWNDKQTMLVLRLPNVP